MFTTGPYDLLLTGGTVVDPSQKISAPRDLAIKDGRIALVAENIPPSAAEQVEDVTGKLVTPGLVDIHGHYYYGTNPVYVLADQHCPSSGVTTAVDAGSAGHMNFLGLRHFVIPSSQTRLFALLNIAGFGLLPGMFNGELLNLGVVDVDQSIDCINRNRDVIVGTKVRMAFQATGTENALPALDMAIAVAGATGTRVTVHIANTPLPLARIFERLRSGDIVAHIYNPRHHHILDWNRNVIPEVWEAKNRGLLLDASKLGGLDFNIARVAIEQGLVPDIISSDLASFPPGSPLCTLPEVLSIFLELGLSVEQVIACATTNAALAIDKQNDLGTLRPGACADVAVFNLEPGDFPYRDTSNNLLHVKKLLAPYLTVRQGKAIWRGSNAKNC